MLHVNFLISRNLIGSLWIMANFPWLRSQTRDIVFIDKSWVLLAKCFLQILCGALPHIRHWWFNGNILAFHNSRPMHHCFNIGGVNGDLWWDFILSSKSQKALKGLIFQIITAYYTATWQKFWLFTITIRSVDQQRNSPPNTLTSHSNQIRWGW